MSLETRRGNEASSSYEYDFFDEFAWNLREMFEQDKTLGDAILIGFPKVPKHSKLKPDCVLITHKRIVIVDFKNHDGKISLPRRESFDTQPWRHTDENGKSVVVDGGTYQNPFDQLNAYRAYTEELIGRETYGNYGVACMVCFQKEMKIINEERVPGKHERWFSVVNKREYANKIKNFITLKGNAFLDLEKMKEIASFFEASPYKQFIQIDYKDVQRVEKLYADLNEAERKENEHRKKEKELQEKIAENSRLKMDTSNLERELSASKRESEELEKAFKDLKEQYERERNSLDHDVRMAEAAAKKAQSEAKKAQSEAEKIKSHEKIARLEERTAKSNESTARSEARAAKSHEKEAELNNQTAFIHNEIQRNKFKTMKAMLWFLAALVFVVAAIVIILRVDENNRKKADEDSAKAQLEEDYRSGRTCIPIERVSDFIESKNVCVEFNVYYVNYNDFFVYLNYQEKKFQLVISNDKISWSDAKAKYNKKRVRAVGNIIKHGDIPEIMIYDLNQITIIE